MKRFFLISVFFLMTAPAAFSQPTARLPIGPEIILPGELEGVSIAGAFVASETEPVGQIETVVGHVVVLHGDNASAYVATGGDTLFKADTVFTLADSRCRIQFFTEDLITMAADTRVGIQAFMDSPETGEKSSIIKILRGKAMFYVFRLFRYRKIASSVQTPTAIVGVRGTKFGTEVRVAQGLEASASGRYLADASGAVMISQAPPAVPRIETIVHCFEGAVEVFSPADGTSQTVPGGKSIAVTGLGAGGVQTTPPDVARQFARETEAPAPEDAEDSSGGDRGDTESGASDASASEASLTEDSDADGGRQTGGAEDVVQAQTALKTEEGAIAQGKAVGYLAAMLTRDDAGEKSFKHLYISDTRQDFSIGESIEAKDAVGGTGGQPLLLVGGGEVHIEETGEDFRNPRLASLDVNEDGTIDTIRGPFPVKDADIGDSEYLTWGYWTQPEFMTSVSGRNYLIDNRGYFIFGRPTTDAEMSNLSANSAAGIYRGSANGTYWTDTRGADMQGSFSADVDFGQKQVSNFAVSVSGGGHQVGISSVNGTFQKDSSQFVLDPNTAGSSWRIDGQEAPAGKKEAYGSIYGPGGEKIGGVWKLDAPAGQAEAHATGIFEGSR